MNAASQKGSPGQCSGYLAAALVLIITALLLHLMGRSWWCSCGEFRLYAAEVLSSHNSQHLFDAYSFTHVSHGLIFFALGSWLLGSTRLRLRLLVTVILESAWELLENSSFIIERYRAATMSLNYYGDSVINSLGDIGCCILGFLIAARVPWKLSLALFFFMEFTLLATIRDNLTLNILMLLYPIPAIRSWQAG